MVTLWIGVGYWIDNNMTISISLLAVHWRHILAAGLNVPVKFHRWIVAQSFYWVVDHLLVSEYMRKNAFICLKLQPYHAFICV